MAEAILKITKTHPRLTWLTDMPGSRRVPPRTVELLSKIQDMGQAQGFVQDSGLEVLENIKRFTISVNSVSVAQPEGLDNYYAPQIVLPKIDCDVVPIGSALMNCLLPKTENLTEAEGVFQKFQAMVLSFSEKMEALPFACITGYKTKDPSHNLDNRGFRFFFSPNPDILYGRIKDMLETFHAMDSPSTESTKAEELVSRFLELKFCMHGEESIGHSLLEDIKVYEKSDTTLPDTTLVDTTLIDTR